MPADAREGRAPDAAALAAALAALGLPARVEAQGTLAVLSLAAAVDLPDAADRSAIVAAAREAGFASVALALDHDPESP